MMLWLLVGRKLEFLNECFGLSGYTVVDDEVFAVMQLSEEVNRKLEVIAPFIVFFCDARTALLRIYGAVGCCRSRSVS